MLLSIAMTTLKELTLEKHRAAEEQPFIQSMIQGKVDTDKYTDYLYQLCLVYQRLEQLGDNLGLFDGIESVKRSDLIALDWQELAQGNTYAVKPSTQRYLDYLDTIAKAPDQLMAHIYVRHMGDMFGGQMLSKVLPGSNRMYQFENLPALIAGVRQRLSLSMAPEANTAFDFNIDMAKEYND